MTFFDYCTVTYYEDTKFALSRIFCENVFEDQEIVSSRTRQSYNFEDKYFQVSVKIHEILNILYP